MDDSFPSSESAERAFPIEPIDALYSALEAELGILLAVRGDISRARAKLYQARREAFDPRLQELEIRISALGEGDITIIKRPHQQGSSK